ncbi:lipoprotein, partial [Alistipes indistinctus]|uniref:lipoprotein n=1 Tax=Alistipes indistinctus TaxID=626932 RepID=UPI003F052455
MKKILLLAASLALTLTACQKDEGLVSDGATTSSFTVTIPQSGVQSRAVTDAFGTGTSANRCILEIYHDGKLYDRIEKGVSAKTVTFDNLRLVSSQTYDFVFWADCAEGSEGSF